MWSGAWRGQDKFSSPWSLSSDIAFACAKSFQLCPAVCKPMDHSVPGSSVLMPGLMGSHLRNCQPAIAGYPLWAGSTAICSCQIQQFWLICFVGSGFSAINLLFILLQTGKWEKAMATYSPWGLEESDTAERLQFHFSLSCIGEGNGNPLQCSCLENPRDRGAWWAAVYEVTQNQTWLKWFSSSSNRLGIVF